MIKVNGLTLENYTDTYNHLSELIGISSDSDARKATQQTVLSHDPNLYYNPYSLLYDCTNTKKVSSPIKEKIEKCIGTNETFLNNTNNEDTIRFNNIDEYFTGEYSELGYRVFNEKVMICSPFIPRSIEEGYRNKTLFYLLSQYAQLNPHVGKSWLRAIAETINKKMFPNLSAREINSVIDSVLTKSEDNSLELYFNQERRILFNPNILFTSKQKMEIVNKVLGKLKSDHTKDVIYLVLEDWDFNVNGKITQEKVAQLAKRGKSTVKRYWGDFKSYVKDLNRDYKESSINQPENITEKPAEAQKGITTEKYIYNMRCKFTDFDYSDEKTLMGLFTKKGITHVTDEGFKPIHDYMVAILKDRHYNYRQ
ncbi:hypothetical protein [Flavobacterium sp.]|uniref:hypothetical protein n=1 Tax=Flavobacterium sp. TaxID=239 RepID=UPI003A8F75DC